MDTNYMENVNKLVVVTGGTGYIASWIIKYLVERDYQVRAIVHDIENQSKTRFLRSLPNVEIVQGNLENADYNVLLKDCWTVIHTAIPFAHNYDDPMTQVINPTIAGIKSILNACSTINSIQKFILTSTDGTIIDVLNPNLDPKSVPYTEEDWNNDSTLESCPYFYAKVLTERFVWQFQKNNNQKPDTNHFQVSVLNPSFVLGPSLTPTMNESQRLAKDFLYNAAEPYPTRVGVVDVRNVAHAHVIVLEHSESDGHRYILSGSNIQWKDIAQCAQNIHPDIKFNVHPDPKETLIPKWSLNTSKIQSLGLSFIPFSDSIRDMLESWNSSVITPPEL
eukprot:gene14168-16700_t